MCRPPFDTCRHSPAHSGLTGWGIEHRAPNMMNHGGTEDTETPSAQRPVPLRKGDISEGGLLRDDQAAVVVGGGAGHDDELARGDRGRALSEDFDSDIVRIIRDDV